MPHACTAFLIYVLLYIRSKDNFNGNVIGRTSLALGIPPNDVDNQCDASAGSWGFCSHCA